MADIKPVYLISGEDEPRIDAWRTRARRRAEEEGGPGALEAFEGKPDGPEVVAAAVSALSFATGIRWLLADGVEAWKPADLEPLERQMADMPPDTVLVLIARGAASDRLAAAVKKAGGEAREYAAPKARDLPPWVIERAREEGLKLDHEAAGALVAAVGPRQQRLAREIERLALAAHPRATLTAEEVEDLAAGESTQRAYDLADAVVARDLPATLRLAEDLRSRDERASGLLYPIVRRLRELQHAAELLDRGTGEAEVARGLRAPPWLARRTVSQARAADRESLERALCCFADLEIELRGGGALDHDAALSVALAKAAA